jgi:hypothetical protein
MGAVIGAILCAIGALFVWGLDGLATPGWVALGVGAAVVALALGRAAARRSRHSATSL